MNQTDPSHRPGAISVDLPWVTRTRIRLGLDPEPGTSPSTGFLPLSLALGLFVTGLFATGIIPTARCQSIELNAKPVAR